jgi:hypothetical protein
VVRCNQEPPEVRVTVNTISCVDLVTVSNAFDRGHIDQAEATQLHRSSLGLDPSSELGRCTTKLKQESQV